MKHFDHNRARETARRLREGLPAMPLVERETVKQAGDLVISSTKVEHILPDHKERRVAKLERWMR